MAKLSEYPVTAHHAHHSIVGTACTYECLPVAVVVVASSSLDHRTLDPQTSVEVGGKKCDGNYL